MCYPQESAIFTCSFFSATSEPTHRLFLFVMLMFKMQFLWEFKRIMVSLFSKDCLLSTGCKYDQCRKFYTLSGDKWNEASVSHSFSRIHLTEHISATQVVHNVMHTVQPTATLHTTESTDIHLISSSAIFCDSPFGMAVRSLVRNNFVVYLRKGECHIAQQQTKCMLGLTEQGWTKLATDINFPAIGHHPIST